MELRQVMDAVADLGDSCTVRTSPTVGLLSLMATLCRAMVAAAGATASVQSEIASPEVAPVPLALAESL